MIPPGEKLDFCFASHAEISAIGKAAKDGIFIEGATLYTTTFPCVNCAKVIAASGIKEVIFFEDYANERGALILEGAFVKMTKINNGFPNPSFLKNLIPNLKS
ncbi:MAG: hypothetical protein ACD_63C00148G0011 [uncultured bacterium]|nr:MAG: hypothetical protein ACD_63C00148G0011 [uncultured bacterium]